MMPNQALWRQAKRKAYWHDLSPARCYPELAADDSYDVVIVGAGITGLTAAMRLHEAGMRVVVVEMNRVGRGTTGSSTGHLDTTRDQTIRMVIDHFGKEAAQLVVNCMRDAVNQVEEWNTRYALDAGFQRINGYLYTEDESGVAEVEREFEAYTEFLLDVELTRDQILPFPTRLAMRLRNQARFNALRYVVNLAERFVERGGSIFECTRMKDVLEGEPCRVFCDKAILSAQHVLIAAHCPLLGLLTMEPRVRAAQSYVLAMRMASPIDDALFWDTADPYHYIARVSSDPPGLVLLGGADHDTGETTNTENHYDALEEYARDRFHVASVEYCWSHEYFEPADGLPYIGKLPGKERLQLATGFSGDGLKFGTIAGLLMADQVLGRAVSEKAELFSPARLKPMACAMNVFKNFTKIAQHMIADRLKPGDVHDLDEIPPGEGAIVMLEGQRRAVYRDLHGEYHVFSPVCRHAGGIVQWNSAAKTWDCPVHGGRYDAMGCVIMGPPVDDLSSRSVPQPVLPV